MSKFLDENGLSQLMIKIKQLIVKTKLTDEDVLSAAVRTDFCQPAADNDNKLFISDNQEVYIL